MVIGHHRGVVLWPYQAPFLRFRGGSDKRSPVPSAIDREDWHLASVVREH